MEHKYQLLKTIYQHLGLSFGAWIRFFYYNFICHQIESKSRIPVLCNKHTVFDFADNSRIIVGDNLEAGKRHLSKSEAETQIKVEEEGVLEVSSHFIMYAGSLIHILKGGHLKLGGGSFVNEYVRITCGGKIEIGEGTAIGPGVVIRSADGHQLKGSPSTKPIVIGSHVWIGEKSIILKGVNIGNGAVIGAGSIVTTDIPAHSLAVGVPARVIKENISWY